MGHFLVVDQHRSRHDVIVEGIVTALLGRTSVALDEAHGVFSVGGDADTDLDNDGLTNLYEYLVGTDPTIANTENLTDAEGEDKPAAKKPAAKKTTKKTEE